MTIHIVEDDAGVRDALAELCQTVGVSVATYPDIRSFRSQGRVDDDDQLLIDLDLPDGRGQDLIRTIRNQHRDARIIVISGLSSAAIRDALRGIDGIPVVRKPLTAELLGLLA
jgi:FixJ family two-component response regulator